MNERELFYYGISHGYWEFDKYHKRSQHDKDLVLNIAIKELTGKSLNETVQLNIEWLKDFAEKIRIKNHELDEMLQAEREYPTNLECKKDDTKQLDKFIKTLKI
jgi:predicted component of type VI protein secretion system